VSEVKLPWVVHDPREDEWWCYPTEAEATAKAEALIDSCCADGGWDEQTDEIVVSLVMHSPVKRLLHRRTPEMSDDQWYELCGDYSDEHDEWFTYDLKPTAAADEIVRLRAYKEDAVNVLNQWYRMHEAIGSPGRLGQVKSEAVEDEIVRLRAELDAANAEMTRHRALVNEFQVVAVHDHDAEVKGAVLSILRRHGFTEPEDES
jgi:hypothetical protein